MFLVPRELAERARRRGVDWSAWVDSLPAHVDACVRRWALHLERSLPAYHSLVVEASRADGTAAVLKLNFPEPETDHEADGLRRWDGRGVVRLLDADPDHLALLLEPVVPGTPLWDVPEDEALPIAVSVLPQLWRAVEPDHPFERVAPLAARWSVDVRELFSATGRRFEPELAEAGATAFTELGQSQGEQLLLHRDFHGGNVLAAVREPWLAIGPKPTVGEREFDAAWLLGDRPGALTAALARRRLDRVSGELRLDRERLRRWTVARYVLGGLWSYESGGDGRWAIGAARIYRCADRAPAAAHAPWR